MGWFLALCLFVGMLIGNVIWAVWLAPPKNEFQNTEWQCTASRVINDTLPREEECTQYTKKEEE